MKSVLILLLAGALCTTTSVGFASNVQSKEDAKELTLTKACYDSVDYIVSDTVSFKVVPILIADAVIETPEFISGNYSPCSKEGNIYNWKEPNRKHNKKWVRFCKASCESNVTEFKPKSHSYSI